MAGGIYAIRRDWFFEAGGYDDGLEVWGGENIEMSLRMWMCGGMLLSLPCSRVGHVFRSVHPFTWPRFHKSVTMLRNARRVAAVWLDDHAQFVGGRMVTSHLGHLEERHAVRRRLRCRSFAWYLAQVYTEMEDPARRN